MSMGGFGNQWDEPVREMRFEKLGFLDAGRLVDVVFGGAPVALFGVWRDGGVFSWRAVCRLDRQCRVSEQQVGAASGLSGG